MSFSVCFLIFQYIIKVDMKRSLLNKDLGRSCEFIVEYRVSSHTLYVDGMETCVRLKPVVRRKGIHNMQVQYINFLKGIFKKSIQFLSR